MTYKIFIILVVSILLGCDNKPDDELRVATSADYPPFEYVSQGKIVGFEIDLANEIGRRLGKKIRFLDMDFHAIIGAIHTKRADVAMSAISATRKRARQFDFISYPYNTNIFVVYHKDHVDKINNFKKAGLQFGTTTEHFVRKKLKISNKKIIALSKNTLLCQQLLLGRIDVILTEKSQAEFITNSDPNLRYKEFAKTDEQYAIAIRKNSPLKSQIQSALNDIEKDGTFNKLYNKWFLPNTPAQ